jgi:hypothetical protein
MANICLDLVNRHHQAYKGHNVRLTHISVLSITY